MSGSRGGVHNWVFGQGTTWKGEFTWLDANGVPVNLTGYSADMQIRLTPESDTTVADLTTEDGDIVLGGADGTVSFSVHAEQTKNIDPKTYKYDINLTSEGGEVTRVLEGDVCVTAAVTR